MVSFNNFQIPLTNSLIHFSDFPLKNIIVSLFFLQKVSFQNRVFRRGKITWPNFRHFSPTKFSPIRYLKSQESVGKVLRIMYQWLLQSVLQKSHLRWIIKSSHYSTKKSKEFKKYFKNIAQKIRKKIPFSVKKLPRIFRTPKPKHYVLSRQLNLKKLHSHNY